MPAPHIVRWGIVGSGAVAHRFVAGLAAVPQAEFQAVWGRSPTSTSDLASSANAESCHSLEGLLASEIDAVYIATQPDTHALYSLAALRAGKHVLCEKPVTLDKPHLIEVLATAHAHQRLFMEAMKPPFFPLYRRLRQHLEQEPIGPVAFVRSGHSTAAVPPGHSAWLLDGGGSLMGIGVYQAFLAVDWLGEAHDVQTLGRLAPTGVDAFASLQTRHTAGTAQLFSGLDLSGPGDATLVGQAGYAVIHEPWWNPVAATIRYRDGRRVELNEPFQAGGFNYETAHFCDLLRAGAQESPILTHRKSLQVMDILDRSRQALGVRFPWAG